MTKAPPLSEQQIAEQGRALAVARWELPEKFRLTAALLDLPPEELKANHPDVYALWEKTKEEQARLAAQAALPHGRPSSQETFRARSVQRAEEVRIDIVRINAQLSAALTGTGVGNVSELQAARRALRHKRAEYLSQHGRYDLAFEEEPDPDYRDHYLAILDAIWREDEEHCGHGEMRGSGQHANVKVASFNAKEDVWSLKHGRMVTLMKCTTCGFMNALDTPAHVRQLREHRARAHQLAGHLSPSEAAKVLREAGHTSTNLLK